MLKYVEGTVDSGGEEGVALGGRDVEGCGLSCEDRVPAR